MDTLLSHAVKALYEEGASGFRKSLQFRLGDIQTGHSRQVVYDFLPSTAIVFVMLGGELGNPERTVCSLNRGLGAGTSQ